MSPHARRGVGVRRGLDLDAHLAYLAVSAWLPHASLPCLKGPSAVGTCLRALG